MEEMNLWFILIPVFLGLNFGNFIRALERRAMFGSWRGSNTVMKIMGKIGSLGYWVGLRITLKE